MSDNRITRIEEKVENIEKDVSEIKQDVKDINKNLLSISNDMAEIKTLAREHDKRIDRLGFRFCVFIGIIITGLLSLVHKAYF